MAFVMGILLDRFWPQSAMLWWTAGAIGWVVWLLTWLLRRERVAALLLFAAIGTAGGAWHHVHWFTTRGDEIGRLASQESSPVCLEAIALTNPRWSPAPPHNPMQTIPSRDRSEIQLQVVRARDGINWRAVSGKTRLTVDGRLRGVKAGDRVQVFARMRKPAATRNPGDFDYARFLKTRGQFCQLGASFPDCVSVIARGSAWSPRRLIGDVRQRFNNLLWRHVDHDRSALASTILLGAREQLDRERTEAFFTTGTIHLLAISGLHVGMLAYVFWLMARVGMLTRRKTLLAAAIFVVLYAMLTGARPPVMRAAILIVTICGARLIGRQAFSFNTLAIAAILILAINPTQLFQAGTQLSFLAVATLGVCAPMLVRRPIQDPLARLIAGARPLPVKFSRRAGGFAWRLWLTSTLIWLVALPLVLFQFHFICILKKKMLFPFFKRH